MTEPSLAYRPNTIHELIKVPLPEHSPLAARCKTCHDNFDSNNQARKHARYTTFVVEN